MSLTTQLLMDLIDGYAETRHQCGRPDYNPQAALARKLVLGAVEVVVKKASAPLFDVSKGIPPAVGLVALPVIDPSLLPTKETA
jgi:hypothetical protein